MFIKLRAVSFLYFYYRCDLSLPAAAQQGNKPNNPLHHGRRTSAGWQPSNLPPAADGPAKRQLDRIGNEGAIFITID